MRLPRKLFTPLIILLLSLAGSTITACGKKGPLYLPPTDAEIKAKKAKLEMKKTSKTKTATEQSQ